MAREEKLVTSRLFPVRGAATSATLAQVVSKVPRVWELIPVCALNLCVTTDLCPGPTPLCHHPSSTCCKWGEIKWHRLVSGLASSTGMPQSPRMCVPNSGKAWTQFMPLLVLLLLPPLTQQSWLCLCWCSMYKCWMHLRNSLWIFMMWPHHYRTMGSHKILQNLKNCLWKSEKQFDFSWLNKIFLSQETTICIIGIPLE